MLMQIGIVLGSIRENRKGESVTKWAMSQLVKNSDVKSELLDLKDYQLPVFAESKSPMEFNGDYPNIIAQKWSAKVDSKDAFIFITPEYNHGTSAALKNALDWLYPEWAKKPVAFISYSPTAAGGVRAVEQLRQNVVQLQMVPLNAAVHIPRVQEVIDDDGKLLQEQYNDYLNNLVKDLSWWAKALKAARELENA